MTRRVQSGRHGRIDTLLLPLFVVVLAFTWLGLYAGTDSAAFSPDAPRFLNSDGFNRGAIDIVDRYDHGRDPTIRPAPGTAPPQALNDDCTQLLANPSLTVVNGSIPSWSILKPKVYYSTQTYVSPPSAIVLPEGDDGDPSPKEDAFGQIFTMPSGTLSSVTIEFQTRTGNTNATDKASGNLWTVSAGNNLDQFIGGWNVADSADAWAGRTVQITDSADLGDMAGQKMAIIFFTDANGQSPGEIVYFDDITLTACSGAANTPTPTATTGPAQTPTVTPTTGPAQTPTVTPTGQPGSEDKLFLPVICKPERPSQPTPTPTASPEPPPPGNWTLETVPNQTNQGGWTSIALDTSGNPHISFNDITRRRIMYTHRTGAGWQTQDIDEFAVWVTDLTAPSAVAVGPNNHPQIAYIHNSPVVNLRYAEWDGVNWNGVHFVGTQARWLAMALKQDGEPCISYYKADSGPRANMARIYLLCRSGGAWPTKPETVTIILGGIHDMGNSLHALAIDSANRRHVAYAEGGSVYYVGEPDGNTIRPSKVDHVGGIGFYPSLAIDSQDRPHISYYDVTNGDLKYARRDGSEWHVETVDSGGDVGKYTSIEVDGGDRPHISYYDVTNKNLKYASWTGNQWLIETVDSAGEVGEFTSLALSAAGQAHISYTDRGNGDLKVATNGAAALQD
jgi:hypothetical protein